MATRALKSVTTIDHQRQQSTTNPGLDLASHDLFSHKPILPPDHPVMRQHLTEDSGKRGNGRSSPQKPKELSRDANAHKPPVDGTRTKRSASFKSLLGKDTVKSPKKKSEKQEEKSLKKSKSSTSLSALLSRPRSSKGSVPREEEVLKDKENQTPPGTADLAPPPIWAQFATRSPGDFPSTKKVPLNDLNIPRNQGGDIAMYAPKGYSPPKQRSFHDNQRPMLSGRAGSKARPISEFSESGPSLTSMTETLSGLRRSARGKGQSKAAREEPATLSGNKASRENNRPTSQKSECEATRDGLHMNKRGSRVMTAVAAFNGKSKELPKEPVESLNAKLDPKAIETAFEALLDTRNVPQATRDKMRSLDTSIKADFIKQDKAGSGSASSAESLATQQARPITGKRSKTDDGALEHTDEHQITESPKKSRPRSLTFTFSKGDQSPSKRQKSGSHQRAKSGDLTPSNSSKSPSRPNSGHGISLFSKADKFALPDQVIAYLRKVQEPQSVEVGKIHKLRQLLRNETVCWVETFVTQGGMTELVNLLYRIIAVEWREEHEDTLLHETLLCLKALTTTSSAMAQISIIHSALFPTLLHLLFDDERKGPSEYTTRTIIFHILSSYLATSASGTLASRASTLLTYLRDPSKPAEAQAPEFITSIYHPRPYRIWNKELNNLIKEVFWIFLHHLNIIPYPPISSPSASAQPYSQRHFPREHPPVPAAPYIGGVEWDATAYLTAHLDLINGLIASLSTREERNQLRQEMKDSGFEKLMGGSFRTCKEKFYGSVHEALSVWVGAAREDGWSEKDVRQGPPREEVVRSPVKKGKKGAEAPKLDMPKLELGGGEGSGDGGWL